MVPPTNLPPDPPPGWMIPPEGHWQPIELGDWRGVSEASLVDAAKQLGDPEAWLRLEGAETLKDARNVLARVPWPGHSDRKLFLKIFPVRGLVGMAQSGWRQSKARKAWEKAWVVRARGFETPTPRMALERRVGGRLAASALWVDWAEGGQQLRALLKPWRKRPRSDEETRHCHEFLARLAGYLRTLHDAGIVHRDFGGGNVLIGDPERTETWTLIDINRARLTIGPALWRGRLLDLERVHLHPEDREPLFRAYARSDEECAQWLPRYLKRAETYRRKKA